MEKSAKSLYEDLSPKRHGVLRRARMVAELTIPALMPPEGATEETDLPTPFQSLGARGVNNLASKLLLSLLPPDTPFFRNRLDPKVLEDLGASRDAVEEAMREYEMRVIARIERSNARPLLFQALKQLIVAGNFLLWIRPDGDFRGFRLDHYAIRRDPLGNVLDLVAKETVAGQSLDEDLRAAVGVKEDEKEVDVYTRATFEGGRVKWWQEIKDQKVPDSEGSAPKDESPFVVMRWQALPGEDYGRGHGEEYLGDLQSLEGLSKAVIQFAAVASKIIFLVASNATTNPKELAEAESGDFVDGELDDIGVLQIDKFAEFQAAREVISEITLRLSHAFLLQSGTVRNAERVTASEIQAMAQELEDVLGGVYTVQAREFQLPTVRRMIALMRSKNELPALPKGVAHPTIITGFDALGRGHELNRLRAYFADLAAVMPAALQEFSPRRVANKMGTQHNVELKELFKTDEEKEAEAQQMQQQQIMDKAAGPVAGAMAKSMTQ
ncbi:MAG: portal protein [Lysobacteraceae bacterium]